MKIKVTSIFVDDQDKALRFYTEVLGFAKTTDFSQGPYRWLTVASAEEPDGTELHLALNNNPQPKRISRPSFNRTSSQSCSSPTTSKATTTASRRAAPSSPCRREHRHMATVSSHDPYTHMRNLHWSPAEKAIACRAFDFALHRELGATIREAKDLLHLAAVSRQIYNWDTPGINDFKIFSHRTPLHPRRVVLVYLQFVHEPVHNMEQHVNLHTVDIHTLPLYRYSA
jgi:hypothetical protein